MLRESDISSSVSYELDGPAASRSGFAFSRVDDRSRVLRLQADESLVEALRPSRTRSEGGLLTVPSREQLERGEAVRVEVSFGAMADEIMLRGNVEGLQERIGRSPLIAVRIEWDHAARVRYILDVLKNGRAATARSSRRVPSDIEASWNGRFGRQRSTLKDISKGGAFVRAATPPAQGARIEMSLDDSMVDGAIGSLDLDATVAWSGRSQGTRGFGVKFHVPGRALASRISALVRWQERSAGLVD